MRRWRRGCCAVRAAGHPPPGSLPSPGAAPDRPVPPPSPALPVSLAELNAVPGRAPRQHVRFLPAPGDDGATGLVAARVPVLADHPLGKGRRGVSGGGGVGSPGGWLRTGPDAVCPVPPRPVAVRGPRFRRLKIGAGHRLDVKASGVFGGSRPGAAPRPAGCEVMGFCVGKKR